MSTGQRVAQERLEEMTSGKLRYTLKRPWRDGTVALVLEPLDLLARGVRASTDRAHPRASRAAARLERGAFLIPPGSQGSGRAGVQAASSHSSCFKSLLAGAGCRPVHERFPLI